METNSRSLAKALSYRLFGSLSTALIVYVIRGDASIAIGAGAADSVIKLGLYYLHERLWQYVPFGRAKPPEYEI
jgi:uncharacterized membrane protein